MEGPESVSQQPFTFGRHRGIVWVCDIERSSSYLNAAATAGDLEKFLPRLLHVAKGIVEAAGGRLIKFTGDGFLAWFQFELHRELELVSPRVLTAAWQATFIVNITQLGLSPVKKFRIRHGITYEQDALVILNTSPEHQGTDLIGRSVAHAFRLSGIPSSFPNVVIQAEIAHAVGLRSSLGHFKKVRFSGDDRLRYFKGERFGTDSVYAAVASKSTRPASTMAIKRMKRVVRAVENGESISAPALTFAQKYRDFMVGGPSWCQELYEAQTEFLNKQMFAPIKTMLRSIEEQNRRD